MGKRKIRIEKARCLRKLSISLPTSEIQEGAFLKILGPWVHESDITVVEELATQSTLIVKLRDDIDAERAILELRSKFSEWEIEWLSSTTSTPTSVSYNGGAFKETPFGSPLSYYPNNYPTQYPFLMSMALSMGNVPRSPPLEDISFEMDRLSISPPPPHIIPCSSPPGFEPEIFVGRINPFHADAEELRQKFSKYGEIESMQVINRPHGKLKGYNNYF